MKSFIDIPSNKERGLMLMSAIKAIATHSRQFSTIMAYLIAAISLTICEAAFATPLKAEVIHSSSGSYYLITYWLLILTIAVLLYRSWRRQIDHSNKTRILAGYEPPAGIEASQIGLLYDQKRDSIDLGAGILELAYDGYINIDGDTLQQLKSEYHTLSSCKQNIMRALFSCGKTISINEEQPIKDRLQLFDKLKKTKEALYNRSMKQGFIHRDPKKELNIFRLKWLTPIILLFPIACAVTATYAEKDIPFIVLGGTLTVVIEWFGLHTLLIYGKQGKIIRSLGVLMLLFALIIEGMMMIKFTGSMLDELELYKLVFMPIATLFVTAKIISSRLQLQTAQGAGMLAQVLAYKNFLQHLERDKLAHYIKEHPDYMERILPFTVALNMSKQWLQHIEQLTPEKIKTYQSQTLFMTRIWYHNLTYVPQKNI